MRSLLLLMPLTLAGISVNADAQNVYKEVNCAYSDSSTGLFLNGPCTLHETKIHGHFAYLMNLQGRKISIEYVKSSGPDHLWKLNDKDALGYEINREHLRGTTFDLNQSVEWQDRTEQAAAASEERSNAPLEPAPQPSSSEPAGAVVQEWSGNGLMRTRPFHVSGPWELQWTSSDLFQVMCYREGGSMPDVLANQIAEGKSSSFVAQGGTYYLKINAMGHWSARVVASSK